MSNLPLVIYHSNCNDGSAAATCAYKHFGLEAEYYPASHGSLFDCAQVKDRKVYFLDFCFPIDIMKEIKLLAKKLTILDHHKTAQEALKELTFEGQFDMEKSGARLAFEHFVAKDNSFHDLWPSQYLTFEKFVNWVQDRDLRQFKLESTREVNDYLFSLPSFIVDTAMIWLDLFTGKDQTDIISAGKAISQYRAKQTKLALHRAFKVKMFNEEVWLVNETGVCSDTLDELACKGKFSASYYVNADGKHIYSLRSKGEFDVSELAKSILGGGGHKNTAGCSSMMPLHEKI